MKHLQKKNGKSGVRKMLSKEEYIELYVKGGQAINAILEVLNNLAEVKVEIAGEEAIKIIRDFQQKYFDLINEHFKPKENTSEFKHFKLHNDSSLKNLTKVELIDYIKMLYHNWGISNDELRRHLYFIEPYNFEDLKVGMWILDRKPQYEEYTFIKIIKILSESDCEYLYHDKDKKIFFDNMECIAREFEENRFFPVQCANLEIEN